MGCFLSLNPESNGKSKIHQAFRVPIANVSKESGMIERLQPGPELIRLWIFGLVSKLLRAPNIYIPK